MLHAMVESLLSQARQERARELSAYDLADEGGWIEGKRGGRYKMVNGRKVYKKGGGGQKPAKAPAAKKAAGKRKPAAPAPEPEKIMIDPRDEVASYGELIAPGENRATESQKAPAAGKPAGKNKPVPTGDVARPTVDERRARIAAEDREYASQKVKAAREAKRKSPPTSLDLIPETLASAGENEWAKAIFEGGDGHDSPPEDRRAVARLRAAAEDSGKKFSVAAMVRFTAQAAMKKRGESGARDAVLKEVKKFWKTDDGGAEFIVRDIERLARYL